METGNKTKRSIFNMKVDMVGGPLLKNYLLYTLPFIVSLLIQNTYNAADMIILGQFASETAVAAVGATSSITSLVVNLFIGFAVGYNIVIVRLFGEKDKDGLKRANSTALILSLSVGIALMLLGLVFAEPLLRLVKCPESILADAAVYARIYFLSLPATMFFNHFSSLIKATGDSVTGVYYLIVSAITNIVLNLLFVVVFKMPVAGVAIATTASIYVTAILCFVKVVRAEGLGRLELSGVRFSFDTFKKLVKYGIPSSITSVASSLVGLLGSSVQNSFGEQVVASVTAKNSIFTLLFGPCYCFSSALTSFMGQNMGARNKERALRVRRYAYTCAGVSSILFTAFMFVFRYWLISLYLPDSPEALDVGVRCIEFAIIPGLTTGIHQIANASLMSLGKSGVVMASSLSTSVAFVAVWYLFIFPINPTIDMMLLLSPINAILGLSALAFEFVFIRRYKNGEQFDL